MGTQPGSTPSKIVYLEDALSDNQGDIDGFTLMNSGMLCIRIISTHLSVAAESGSPDRPAVCNLKYPSQIMKVGVRLLDAMHPNVDR